MFRRLSVAILLIAPAIAVAVADAIYLQQYEPRDRIWLLTVYATSPALVAGFWALFTRRTTTSMLLIVAGSLPIVLRYFLGERSAEASFDRLALSLFRFTLIWLPSALAISVITGPAAADIGRPSFLGRRLWRAGSAFLLMLVVLTFVRKGELPAAMANVQGAFAFCLLLFGTGLLISDTIDSRKQWAALQWTFMLLALVCALLTFGAAIEVEEALGETRRLQSAALGALDVKREILSSAARYETRGALTASDRMLVRSYIVQQDEEHRAALAAIKAGKARLPIAIGLAMIAITLTLLFATVAIAAHRHRSRHDRAMEALSGEA